MLGLSYIITSDVIEDIVNVSRNLPFIPVEDALVIGILACTDVRRARDLPKLCCEDKNEDNDHSAVTVLVPTAMGRDQERKVWLPAFCSRQAGAFCTWFELKGRGVCTLYSGVGEEALFFGFFFILER